MLQGVARYAMVPPDIVGRRMGGNGMKNIVCDVVCVLQVELPELG
jgi:hypothetical protein